MGSADMRSQVSQEHLGVIVRKTPVAHVLQVSYTVDANYLEIIGKRLEVGNLVIWQPRLVTCHP